MENKKANIIIDEQDLFNSVFFPELVSIEKTIVIETDNSYNEIVDFYRKLKYDQNEISGDIIKRKLAEKIPAYNPQNIFYLYPVSEIRKTKRTSSHLAADSKALKSSITTKTFTDNDKEYIVKIMNYGEQTKVFVFSTQDELLKNFDIIIKPHNLKYHFDDNSEPFVIEKYIDAEKIEIRFN